MKEKPTKVFRKYLMEKVYLSQQNHCTFLTRGALMKMVFGEGFLVVEDGVIEWEEECLECFAGNQPYSTKASHTSKLDCSQLT